MILPNLPFDGRDTAPFGNIEGKVRDRNWEEQEETNEKIGCKAVCFECFNDRNTFDRLWEWGRNRNVYTGSGADGKQSRSR